MGNELTICLYLTVSEFAALTARLEAERLADLEFSDALVQVWAAEDAAFAAEMKAA